MEKLTANEILEKIKKEGLTGRKSVETQMYYLNKSRGFAIITCDDKGKVISALCKLGDKIETFFGDAAEEISKHCQENYTETQPVTKNKTR